MSVDTESKHFECTKCHEVFHPREYNSAKKQQCSKLGTHSLKTVQTSWNKSALGATVNLVGRGVSAGANKASKYNSEEAKELREIKRHQDEEKREIRDAQQKIEDQKLADKTMKFYNFVKPYLKYIIPIYIVAFIVVFLLVKTKHRPVTGVFFALPLVYLFYLIYNALTNKSK